MTDSCCICNSISTSSVNPDQLTRLTKIFTKSVVKISNSSSKSSSITKQTFCFYCRQQLNKLDQMEIKIIDLKRKCDILKDELLVSTLSTIIKSKNVPSSLCGKELTASTRSKHTGQVAINIAKKTELGFRIYKKWRTRFLKILKAHLNEIGTHSGEPQITDETNEFIRIHPPSHVNKSETSSKFVQIDHSYFTPHLLSSNSPSPSRKKPQFKNKKTLITACTKRRRQQKSLSQIKCVSVLEPTLERNDPNDPPSQNIIQKDEPQPNNSEGTQSVDFRTGTIASTDCTQNQNDASTAISNSCGGTTAATNPELPEPDPSTKQTTTTFSAVDRRVFKCKICVQQFSTKADLEIHVKSHRETKKASREKTFQCDLEICSKLFYTKKQLDIHKRIHGGEKKYLCDSCGSLFLSLASLHSHRKTHLGLKPHLCQVCQQSFRSAGHLTKHLLIHSGEKPFSCPICEKLFNRKENLRVHEFTHSSVKPHKCPKCLNASFTRPILLRKHILEKHTLRPKSSKSTNKISSTIQNLSHYDSASTILLQYSGSVGPSEEIYDGIVGSSFCTNSAIIKADDGSEELALIVEDDGKGSIVQQALLLPDGQYLIFQ